jgi:hypothetical protein
MLTDLEGTPSFRESATGIGHTLFLAPHAVHVAIDPPDSITLQCRTASISLEGSVVAGDIEGALLWQVQEFIARNRAVLIDYWEYRIDTDELRQRLMR